MNPMVLYFVKRFAFSYKKWILLFAVLCGVTGGIIVAPVDKGIGFIEDQYPESKEVMELVRTGTHGINSIAQAVVELHSKYNEMKQ